MSAADVLHHLGVSKLAPNHWFSRPLFSNPLIGPRTMHGTATISPCGLYRYTLTREWGQGPRVLMILINPSTATGDVDDPTADRGVLQAQALTWNGASWNDGDGSGYGSMEFVNLFAYRATDPKVMLSTPVDRVVGPDNDRHILAAVSRASLVIAAWGVPGTHLGRDVHVTELVRRHAPIHCFGVNQGGTPKHPLYLAIPTKLITYAFMKAT